MTSARFPRAVLFDLDGTLLDSAPDFVATCDAMLAERGRAPIDPALLRPVVSKGSRAMVSAAFPELDTAARDALIPEFLQRYGALIGQHAVLFDGVAGMLAALDAAGTVWGIVTNKPEYLARLILPQHGWQQRCAVLVGGDSLAERKPHPLPLLHAAQAIAVAAEDCVYVGDDERDIIAARAAAMPSVAALWGYRLHSDDPLAWQADVLVENAGLLQLASLWPTRPAAVGRNGRWPPRSWPNRNASLRWRGSRCCRNSTTCSTPAAIRCRPTPSWRGGARSCAAGLRIVRATRWVVCWNRCVRRGRSWPKRCRIWLKRAPSHWMRPAPSVRWPTTPRPWLR
jgi:phosphoglycolate phosphatase